MEYASYRARGMQLGSGSVESACKQLVSARLKGAGMIWDAEGAEAVAAVRAWLKSERWEEAVALRGGRRRSYRSKQAECTGEESDPSGKEAQEASEVVEGQERQQGSRLPADVLARVQAELAEQRGKNSWGKAWSVKRQQEVAAQREQTRPTTSA
jgi:hypothetical protein